MSEADRHMARVHGDPGQTKADKARRKQARINELANLSGIPAATLRGLREKRLVAVPREHIPGVDGQVIVAAKALSDEQIRQPQWLWYDDATAGVSLGRWQRTPNAAPYVRLDLVLAAAQEPPR